MPSVLEPILKTLSDSRRATLLFGHAHREIIAVSTVDDNGHVNVYGISHSELVPLMTEVGKLMATRAGGSFAIGAPASVAASGGTTGPGTPPIGGPHGMPPLPWLVHEMEAMHEVVKASVGAITQLASSVKTAF